MVHDAFYGEKNGNFIYVHTMCTRFSPYFLGEGPGYKTNQLTDRECLDPGYMEQEVIVHYHLPYNYA